MYLQYFLFWGQLKNFKTMKKIYTLSLLILSSSMMFGQVLFNEVCYDPSNSGLDGDTNGDGVYDQGEDEFVEIYNNSNTNFDISNYSIWDDTAATAAEYIFPTGTLIPPRGVVVVFGGGTPTGNFGGAIILTDTNGMSFNNSGEVITLRDTSGNIVLTFDSDALSNNPNESYTRFPDVTGAFVQHNDSTAVLFSPGTKVDGTSFDTNIVVTSITVQGMGGVDSINTIAGTLHMMAMVMPTFAADTSVTWSLSSGSSLATINSSGLLTAVANGVVTVVATSNDILGTSDSMMVVITNQSTSIQERTNELEFTIFPNPARDQVTINIAERITQIDVYTLSGQLVKSVQPQTNTINVQELETGAYLMRVMVGNKMSTSRLVKQ